MFTIGWKRIPPFVGSQDVVVLNSVTSEEFEAAVVHADREVDGNFVFGLFQDDSDFGVQIAEVSSLVPLGCRLFV
jgi:hypothetical protein